MIVPLKDDVLKRGVSCRAKGEVKKGESSSSSSSSEEEEEEEAGVGRGGGVREKTKLCCGNKLSLSCADQWSTTKLHPDATSSPRHRGGPVASCGRK